MPKLSGSGCGMTVLAIELFGVLLPLSFRCCSPSAANRCCFAWAAPKSLFNFSILSFGLYKDMLTQGIPRELARSVLPVATYSHMFATVNLNNLFKFLGERLHSHAQYEIRVYAEAMLELVRPIVPVAVAAFEKGLTR